LGRQVSQKFYFEIIQYKLCDVFKQRLAYMIISSPNANRERERKGVVQLEIF
jgi:hypothetical protein